MSLPPSADVGQQGKSAKRRRWLTPFVGILLWLTSVGVTTALVTSLVWTLRASGTPDVAEIDDWLWGSRAAKLTALREAFNGNPPIAIDPQWTGLEAFFNELTNDEHSEEDSKWMKSVDFIRFRSRRLDSPWIKSLSFINRRIAAVREHSDFPPREPNSVTRFEILKVVRWNSMIPKTHQRTSENDLVLVFANLQVGFNEIEPMLFWVYLKAGQWKFADWEFVEAGMSEAELTALYERTSHEKQGQAFYTACDHLNFADGSPNDFERYLRLAEDCQVPDIVADRMKYLILSRWWNQQSRGDEVLRLARLVKQPEKIPGIPLVVARALQQNGDADQALVVLDQIESLMGFRLDCVKLRARLLQSQNRRDEAIVEWKRVLDYEPNDAYQLGHWYDLLPKPRKSEVIDWIKARPEPAAAALQFVTANSYRLTPATVEVFLKIAKEIDPDSKETRGLELFRLTKNHQYRAAAAMHHEAAEQADDESVRQQHWREFFENMQMLDELPAAFAAHPDPRAAFRLLFSGFDGGEAIVSLNDAPPLLAAYRERKSDDPWLSYYEGWVAVEQSRFTDADQKFAETERWIANHKQANIESPSKEDDDNDADEIESLSQQVRSQRCRVSYELGEDVKILEDNGHDESVYESLASLAMMYSHWPTLERLNRSFSTVKPNNPWLIYYRMRVLLAARDLKAVRDLLQVANRSDNQQPMLPYLRDQIERELLAAEAPDPIEVYRRSKDRSVAFNQQANKLLNNREWKKLDELCVLHAAQEKNHEVELMRLEAASQQSDAKKVVELLTPWPKTLMARRTYLEPNWREQLIRSLIRLNRLSEAREKALEFRQSHDEVWPLVMTYVVEHDGAGLAKLLAEDELLADAWSARPFVTDPELRSLLTDDAFAEIRSGRQFEFPRLSSHESVVLFLRKPRELTESWLTERLSEQAGSGEKSLEIAPISSDLFIVNWHKARFVVSSVSEPYFNSEMLNSPRITNRYDASNPALVSALNDQTAYWCFVPIHDELQHRNSPAVSVREFASQLLTDEVIGAMHLPAYGNQAKIIALKSEQTSILASRHPFTELDLQTIVLEFPRPEIHLDHKKKRQLLSLAEHHSDPDRRLPDRIDVQLCDASIPLKASFRVHDVLFNQYGGCEVVAEYAGNDPCPGFPALRAGVRYLVPIDRVSHLDTSDP